jgi:hypothetical protein
MQSLRHSKRAVIELIEMPARFAKFYPMMLGCRGYYFHSNLLPVKLPFSVYLQHSSEVESLHPEAEARLAFRVASYHIISE